MHVYNPGLPATTDNKPTNSASTDHSAALPQLRGRGGGSARHGDAAAQQFAIGEGISATKGVNTIYIVHLKE